MEQVLSRGMWVKTGSHIVSPGSTKASFTIQSKTEMAPSARLLVYCIKQSGEIVVDSLNIEVENPFQNEVRTFFSLVFISIFICFSFPISSPSSSLSSPSFFSPSLFSSASVHLPSPLLLSNLVFLPLHLHLHLRLFLRLHLQVSVTIDTNNRDSVAPGDMVTIKGKATPGSFIAFRAVDKSVLLMKEDTDLSVKKVLEELQSYDSAQVWYPFWDWGRRGRRRRMIMPYPSSGRNAAAVFEVFMWNWGKRTRQMEKHVPGINFCHTFVCFCCRRIVPD